MYASVTSHQIKSGQREEFLNAWTGFIYPIVKSLPGVIGGYIMTNPGTNKAMAVILYQTEAQAVAVEVSGQFRKLVAVVAHTVILESITREDYQVNIQV